MSKGRLPLAQNSTHPSLLVKFSVCAKARASGNERTVVCLFCIDRFTRTPACRQYKLTSGHCYLSSNPNRLPDDAAASFDLAQTHQFLAANHKTNPDALSNHVKGKYPFTALEIAPSVEEEQVADTVAGRASFAVQPLAI
jgi:hypothetical protein